MRIISFLIICILSLGSVSCDYDVLTPEEMERWNKRIEEDRERIEEEQERWREFERRRREKYQPKPNEWKYDIQRN